MQAPIERLLVLVAVLSVAFACSDQPAAPDGSRPFEIPDVRASLTATQLAKLVSSDLAAADFFGHAVAVSGDVAVVAARLDDDAGPSSGSAYVFRDMGGRSWIQEAKLVAGDGAAGDLFGESVAVSGAVAVVGAFGDDDAGNISGSAYVFRDIGGGSWVQEAKLVAADAAAGDRFGESVAVSGDVAVVGAFGDGDAGDFSGSAYVFRDMGGGSWIQEAKLVAADAAAGDRFGHAVAVSGNVAVVGATDDDDAGSGSGSAYVFRDMGGGSWIQEAKLVAGDGAAGDRFGESVAVSGDVAVVGARFDDDAGSSSGSAYVFRGMGGGSWTQEAKLVADDAASSDWFGMAVAVSADVAVVGAPLDDDAGGGSGSAYVFLHTGSGMWTQEAKLLAGDAAGGDRFGHAVGVSGGAAVVGATGDDDAGDFSGSAYVFELGLEDGPEAVIEGVIDDIKTLANSVGDPVLTEELEDAVGRLEIAVQELAQDPPDDVAVLMALEQAVDLIESAVDSGLLDPGPGTAFMDELAGVARELAVAAIDAAIARAGDPVKIAEAQAQLASGDTLRASGAFTAAVDKYKDALVSAELA